MPGFPQRNQLVGTEAWVGDAKQDAQTSQTAFDTLALLYRNLKASMARQFAKILSTQIFGVTNGSNAPSGGVGEYFEASVALASVTGWASTVPQNIASLTLSAGDWDVSGWIQFQGGAITGTYTRAAISTTSATLPADGGTLYASVPSASTAVQLTTRTARVNITSTTTVYLVGDIGFSAGTPSAGGTIRARRVR